MNFETSSSTTAARTGLSFTGKTVFATAPRSTDAINLLTAGRPVQPAAKLLDNWFNGNSTGTHVNVGPRPKAAASSNWFDQKTIRMATAM